MREESEFGCEQKTVSGEKNKCLDEKVRSVFKFEGYIGTKKQNDIFEHEQAKKRKAIEGMRNDPDSGSNVIGSTRFSEKFKNLTFFPILNFLDIISISLLLN